jgi:phosphohistidine phosphatase
MARSLLKLYCVRHGEALSAVDDASRPLSPTGIHDVNRLAQYLASCGVEIPTIMHSPKERAKQTATIIGSVMKTANVVEADHGLDELDPLDQILEQIPLLHEDTMLVGHLPFMSQLVSALVTDNPDLPLVRFGPASIVCLEQHEAQRWIINWLVSPQLLATEVACDQTRGLF